MDMKPSLIGPEAEYTFVDRRHVKRLSDGALLEVDILNTAVFDLDDECYWSWASIELGLRNWRRLNGVTGVIPIVDAWCQRGLQGDGIGQQAFENAEGSIILVHAIPSDIVSMRTMKFADAQQLIQILSAFAEIIDSIHAVDNQGYTCQGHGGISENVLLVSSSQGACIRFEPDQYLEWDPIGRSLFSPEQKSSHLAAADMYAFQRVIQGILADEARVPNQRLRRDLLSAVAKGLYRSTNLHWSDRGGFSARQLVQDLVIG